MNGGADNDRLSGGAGNDRMDGGAGNDIVIAGAGNDIVKVRDNRQDTVNCGAGKDTVTVDAKDRVARNCETVKRLARPPLVRERGLGRRHSGRYLQLQRFPSR
jgi:RTX calcium-binding nonapeptide repeat (4 copies)